MPVPLLSNPWQYRVPADLLKKPDPYADIIKALMVSAGLIDQSNAQTETDRQKWTALGMQPGNATQPAPDVSAISPLLNKPIGQNEEVINPPSNTAGFIPSPSSPTGGYVPKPVVGQNLYYFDPISKQYYDPNGEPISNVPKGSIIKISATTASTDAMVFDPGTGKYYKYDENGELKETNYVPKGATVKNISQQVEKNKQNIDSVVETFRDMKGLLDRIPTAEGIGGKVVGYFEKAKSLAGYQPDVKTYESYKEALLGQIAITIGGESGSRLSDQDVKRMRNAIPDVLFNKKERAAGWKFFFKTVNNIAKQSGGKTIFDDSGNIIHPDYKTESKNTDSLEALKKEYGLK